MGWFSDYRCGIMSLESMSASKGVTRKREKLFNCSGPRTSLSINGRLIMLKSSYKSRICGVLMVRVKKC